MNANGKKVLLVDDDADFVEMNKAVLESNGYEVCVAYNGRECLDKARKEKPDFIVLDVMMTTLGEGFETSRALRKSDQTKDIPLLLLTAVNQKFPFQFGTDETWAPADSFIEKPVEPQRLVAEIDRRLRR